VSDYLQSLLAQAAGDPAPVRLRPVSRFEGSGGGLELREDVPRPAAPSSPSRLELDMPRAPAPSGESNAPLNVASSEPPRPAAAPSGPLRVTHETVRESSEATHVIERVLERSERVIDREPLIERTVEHRDTLQPIHETKVVVAAQTATAPQLPGPQVNVAPAIPSVSMHADAEPLPELRRAESPGRFEIAAPAAPVLHPPVEAAAQEVTISIGRLDIRLVREPEAPRRAPGPGRQLGDAVPSLAEYLRERSKGGQ